MSATWKPMRSAPRDGTAILVCDAEDEDHPMAVCYLSLDGTLCWATPVHFAAEDDWKPTHWMPLPEPPDA